MDNLKPAISLANSSTTLSDREFQNMLRSWFEEKGIVSDLRSQVRFKMINVLKDTVIGRDIFKKTSQGISLSKQGINLIVGEYLMQNKYQYSLSIFNTEASVTNIFQEYPIPFGNVAVNEEGKDAFNKEDILNVLELIGISKNSKICEEVLSLYYSKPQNKSLLLCLIAWFSKATNRKYADDKKSIDLSKEPDIIKQIGSILMSYDISLENFKTIVENIRVLYTSEVKSIENKYDFDTNELKHKINCQERKIKDMYKSRKVIEHRLLNVSNEYNALKSQMKDLVKEYNSRELQRCENIHDKELAVKERATISNFKDALNLKLVIDKNQRNQLNPVCELPHCNETCRQNFASIEKLNMENQSLRKQNIEHKEGLLNLSRKYNDLMNAFINCQNKITLLNSRISEESPSIFLDQLIIEGNLKLPEATLEKRVDISDVSSESVTEEILREARLRLKILEEESKEIEDKCLSYLIK